ncbi:uncharacterized protein LOC111697361 [Eurytemora carolleeae]|uniref:uncharacterized protein LOC111697361 n=1 Tax=Eurytemora carolleeae TaxID=1294199 RepID=UPI000C75A1EA|nr:uncharacterized protein LOC111697361 [Eurytemora carolleeae]|eukprot:XP_023323111.1 uncharacterized protein LOC111697361 [Eurytemora affinis]
MTYNFLMLLAFCAAAHAQYYPSYDDNLSGSHGYSDYGVIDYGVNSSALLSSPRSRISRSFTTLPASYTLTASFTLKIPLTDIGTSLSLVVPFSFTFPSTSRSFDGRSFQEDSETGRSFGSTTRADLYSTLEKYIATATGMDGEACLLRAVCEVGAAPEHEDGLMGDAVTTLLTATNTYTSITNPSQHANQYAEAQLTGQMSGNCKKYAEKCPMSLFNLIERV